VSACAGALPVHVSRARVHIFALNAFVALGVSWTHVIETRRTLIPACLIALGLAMTGCASSPDGADAGDSATPSGTPSQTTSLADVPYVPRAKCGEEPRNNFVALEAAWSREDLPDGCIGIIDGGSHWGPEEQAVFDKHPGLTDEQFLAAFGACAYRDFRPYQGELTGELEQQARVSLDICPSNPGAGDLQAKLG